MGGQASGRAEERTNARTGERTPPLCSAQLGGCWCLIVAGYAGLLCTAEQKKAEPLIYAGEMTKEQLIAAAKAANNMMAWIFRHVRGMGQGSALDSTRAGSAVLVVWQVGCSTLLSFGCP